MTRGVEDNKTRTRFTNVILFTIIPDARDFAIGISVAFVREICYKQDAV